MIHFRLQPIGVVFILVWLCLLSSSCQKNIEMGDANSFRFTVNEEEVNLQKWDSSLWPSWQNENTVEIESFGDPVELTIWFSSPISVLSGNGSSTENVFFIHTESGEKQTVTIETDGQADAIRIEQDGQSYAYVATDAGFQEIVQNSNPNELIYLCADLEINQLTVTTSCTLFLTHNLSVKFFLLESQDIGSFSIYCLENGKADIADFYAEAPMLDLIIPSSMETVLENPFYFCHVASVNGQESNDSIRVKSSEQLINLLDEQKYPKLYAGDSIVFSPEVIIPKGIEITLPVTLTFEEGVTVDEPIQMSFTDTASIELTSNTPNIIPVLYDAPNADLIWENCPFSLKELASIFHLSTVNSHPLDGYQLGGAGSSKIESLSMQIENNELLSEDIYWVLEGDLLTAQISCVVLTSTLRSASLTVVGQNIQSVEFDGANGCENVDLLDSLGCYCLLTDFEGKTYRLQVVTEYIPTQLPILSISTENGDSITSKEEYIAASFSIYNENCTYGDFSSLESISVSISGRGNSTWKWDKKPYKLKFDTKISILGLPATKKWVLLANYADKSLIRNYIALDAAKILSGLDYTTSQYPVDLFINGVYQGVYSFGEKIGVSQEQLDLVDNGTDLDTGYLLEVGGTTSEDTWGKTCFQTELMKYVKIKYPDKNTLTEEQVAYIKSYVEKADAAIIAGTDYEDYIDLNSLIDWFILHELSYNLDSSFRRSCFLHKDAGGKLVMGPLWDFDLSFGNFSRTPVNAAGWACLNTTDDYIWTNWMTYLLRDEKFIQKLSARWDEVKYDLLDKLNSEIDEMSAVVSPSAACNFKVWDILSQKIGYQPSYMTRYNSYEKQIQYLKDFIQKRWIWMNENMVVVTDPISTSSGD
jgi:hypothetical protein